MTYPDKLEKYISTGRAEDKPDSFDFWKWINDYDPREDGMEFIRQDGGWDIWLKKKRIYGVNFSLYFHIRPQYGVCQISIPSGTPIRMEDICFAERIVTKVRNGCQVRGTMAEFTTTDRMEQFERFCKKHGA